MKFCILDMYHMHMSDFEIRPKDTYFYVAHTSHFRESDSVCEKVNKSYFFCLLSDFDVFGV